MLSMGGVKTQALILLFFPRCWKALYQILENIKLVEFVLKLITILNLCSEMVSN